EAGAPQELRTLVEPVLGERTARVADRLQPVAGLAHARAGHGQRIETLMLRVRPLPAASVAVVRSVALRLRTLLRARLALLERRRVTFFVPALDSVPLPVAITTVDEVAERWSFFAVRRSMRSSTRTLARSEVLVETRSLPATRARRAPRV